MYLSLSKSQVEHILTSDGSEVLKHDGNESQLFCKLFYIDLHLQM